MKKILIVLSALFVLCACQKSEERILQELGYSEEETALITALSPQQRSRFLESYDEVSLAYLKSDAFMEEKLDEYLKYDGTMQREKLMKLVNDQILTEENAERIAAVFTDPGFLEKNEELYLEHLEDYDTVRDLVERINTLTYLPLYSRISSSDLSKEDLILVNKFHSLAKDYVPEDLTPIEEEYGKGSLRKKVYEAYKELYGKAKEQGYVLRVVSSYRSYDYQEGLYQRYLKKDPQELVDTYSARAGHSEHQTGMAIDVSLPGVSLDEFGKTDAAKWLSENCSDYGFIIRYPEEKMEITGYMHEPWHIRYLGKEIAKDVTEKGMTYDEYYACFVE